jgi:drug/metabolite transporter (DMT)-like permease
MPMGAAVVFAFGALLLRTTSRWNVGVWRTSFVSNLTTSLVFVPFILQGGDLPPWTEWWQAGVTALFFIAGQVTTILALTRGEVSVAAPVLGLKILLVAIFQAVLLWQPLSFEVWRSAGLATLGVMLLNVGKLHAGAGKIVFSMVFAFLSAASFAGLDLAVQSWSPRWGTGTFLPMTFIMAGVLTMGLVPFFEGKLTEMPRAALPSLLGGCGLIAIQSMTIVLTVAWFQKAVEANVVYSTRGLWSLAVVWFFGAALGVPDAGLRGWTLFFRLLGATLLFLAVALLAM